MSTIDKTHELTANSSLPKETKRLDMKDKEKQWWDDTKKSVYDREHDRFMAVYKKVLARA